MFEHRRQPVLSRAAFARRILRFSAAALGIVAGSWIIGASGYHVFQGMDWLDAILNAAMILGGMGPVTELTRPGAKVFAAFYALYSGIIFLVVAGLFFAPFFHRIIHRFHLELDDEDRKRA